MTKFVPRERKHRRLVKQQRSPPNAQNLKNSNAEKIVPQKKTEKEARRAELSRELLAAQSQSTISSKKRKRLEKYVDTKLKRDEERELLQKLGNQSVDTTLLVSSKNLGRGSGETKKESFQRALKERAAGIDVRGNRDSVLFEQRRYVDGTNSDSGDESVKPAGSHITEGLSTATAAEPSSHGNAQALSRFGSGLKRPLATDGSGLPIIHRRKRQKPSKLAAATLSLPWDSREESEEGSVSSAQVGRAGSIQGEDLEEQWNGFSSDASSQIHAHDKVPHAVDTGEPDTEDSSDESIASAGHDAKPERIRSSAFKEWATKRRNEALGFEPSTAPLDNAQLRASFQPRQPSPDPVSLELISGADTSTSYSRPAEAITVSRSDEIQATRMKLPVVQEEQRIMETIYNNPVTVVCGATGSGKTTQLPQMLYEGGYGSTVGKDTSGTNLQATGMIGVTQPRRVAAVSVAKRVAQELGKEHGTKVAYQVRYDTTTGRNTAIKFMTDGILLREISQDFILSKYAVIVIDEAHERSVNTDILIGMLSRVVTLRDELAKEEPSKYFPLKLIIMSATLRITDFTANERLFKTGVPPVVEAEGRQYPVTNHFSRRTQRDYVNEMVSKVVRGHRKLPPGNMLVFLTGQIEIRAVMKKLRDKLGEGSAACGPVQRAFESADQMPLEIDDMEDDSLVKQNGRFLEGEESDSDSEVDITGLDNDPSDSEFDVEPVEAPGSLQQKAALKAHILPLYAALPTAQQMLVFQPPPQNSRLIVLATNVAETSLTIPGIRYVFDSGRSKEKRYDQANGVQTFEIDWISKSSAAQRAGRAGRTGPGHVYRLYSSAVFEQFFMEHTVPEILRSPIESTVLQLKTMEIENVANFPFPTPPDRIQLATADRLLQNLGAIKNGKITDLGRQLAMYPLSPRFGQMLRVASNRRQVLPHTIAIVAALAVGDLLIPELHTSQSMTTDSSDGSGSEEDQRAEGQAKNLAQKVAGERHQAYTRAQAKLRSQDDTSDAMKLLTAVAAYVDSKNKAQFCVDFYLRQKGMEEVQQLRQQLNAITRTQSRLSITTAAGFEPVLPRLDDLNRKILNQIVASGFLDQVAIRADELGAQALGRKPKRAIDVPYRTLQPTTNQAQRSTTVNELSEAESVYIHPSSVLAHLSVHEMPKFVIYQNLSRGSAATIQGTRTPKTRMHPLVAIGPKTLAGLAEGTPLLELGKPIGKMEELPGGKRQCWVGVSLRMPGSSMEGWPLTTWRVLQFKKKGVWEVEKVVDRGGK